MFQAMQAASASSQQSGAAAAVDPPPTDSRSAGKQPAKARSRRPTRIFGIHRQILIFRLGEGSWGEGTEGFITLSTGMR